MRFRNTACLATLLLSFPLVASDAYCAQEDVIYNPTSGNAKEYSSGEYSKIVMGYAINSADATLTELKANNNTATLNSGVQMTFEVRGGQAQYEITSTASAVTVQANNNTLTFKSGSTFKRSDQAYIYAGHAGIDPQKNAVVNGTFEAKGNTITIESGAVFDGSAGTDKGTIEIVAGSTNSEKNGNGNLFSQSNTLTMDGSGFTGSATAPIAFRQIKAADAAANTGNATAGASAEGKSDEGNKLTITNLSNATIETVAIAEASSHEGGDWTHTGGLATARYNTGDVAFGNNVKVTEIYGGKADGGSAIASDNTMSVSGGEVTSEYGGYANATDGTATASANKLTVSAGTLSTVYGGYARSKNSDAAASENTLSLEGGTCTAIMYGGYAEVSSSTDGAVTVQANDNTVTFKSGSTFKRADQAYIYGGHAGIDSQKTAVVSGSFEAKGNTITIESGAVFDGSAGTEKGTIEIIAGITNSEQKGSANLVSQENTLTMDGTSFTGTADKPIVFRQIKAADAAANTGSATSDGNTLTITNFKNATIEKLAIAEATSHKGGDDNATGGTATASNNTGNVAFGDNAKVTEIYGGKADGGVAVASDNTMSVSGGEVTSEYGGYARATDGNATASDNKLTLTDADVTKDLYGGYAYSSKAAATASGNMLSLNGGSYSGNIYGGYADAPSGTSEALNNTIELNEGTDGAPVFTDTTVLYGGYAATSTGNTLKFNNVLDMEAGNIKNFQELTYTYDTLNKDDVILTLKDSAGTDISNATVSVTLSEIYGEDGGDFEIGDTVSLLKNEEGGLKTDGIVLNDPFIASTKEGMYEGYALVLQATKTDILLTRTGDSLNFSEVKNKTVDSIKHFQALNYVYSELRADDVILTVTDANATDVSETHVNVRVSNLLGKDGGEFKIGDRVYLLRNVIGGLNTKAIVLNKPIIVAETSSVQTEPVLTVQAGSAENEISVASETVNEENGIALMSLTSNAENVIALADDYSNAVEDPDAVTVASNGDSDPATGTSTAENKTVLTGRTNALLEYTIELQTVQDETGKDIELILTRTDGKNPLRSGAKAIAEGAAAGLALVNESSNAAIEALRDFSMASGTIAPFMHVQAASLRHETGSSVNVSSVSLVAGLGTGIDTGAGNLSLGAFFEYGKGSYTTNNSFDDRSDIDGDGNSWYMGGGILAKMDFVKTGPGHFYVEGSAHMGTLHNEYDSNDLRDRNGNVAKFDMDSPYYSLHGGIGYVWNMAEGHDLDIYGKYIWTRVQGTDDTLTTKDKFEYDDMDSNRIRLGARYTYKGSERFVPYIGAAFEHEFAGSCDSRAYGYSVAAPSFEGSSGMGELGLMMKPAESLPLSVNLGVQGYVGQKQGVSGNCSVMYEF